MSNTRDTGVTPITSAAADNDGGEQEHEHEHDDDNAGVVPLGGGNDAGEQAGDDEDAGASTAVLDLPLGRPFAIAGDCEILPEGGPDNLPGTFATLCCDCGELFKMNLLIESDKKCPGCGAVYTHALVIGRADDQSLAQEFVDEVLVSNGYEPIIAREEEPADDADDDPNKA